ncbi:MAG: galactokinase [Cellulomonas sp. 14-74-6]|jgi:galactokinase|nr:MAG: galactokinase [Cellulomonas sp. 14-74-6]
MSRATQPSWDDTTGAARATELFTATFGSAPDGVWASPGRINLIGEHVDYNAGLCLPVALPHRTFAAVRARDDDRVRLVSGQADEVFDGTLDELGPGRATGWAAYAGGPAWVLREQGLPVRGFEAAVTSCVPFGAGLSSSAAIEGALALATYELAGAGTLDDTARAELAAACVRAENEVAGAPTGGMDQAVSLRSRADHALLLDCQDLSVDHIPFAPAADGLTVLVIDTRAPHTLNDGQYGLRRRQCQSAADRLGVASLREVTDLDAALLALTDPTQRARTRHVVTEIERVRQFVMLLRAGALAGTGPLLDASHASLRDDYEVSCDELDVAVETARSSGALGARMTGGGFGGSAIALVPAADVQTVIDAVSAAYAHRGWGAPGFLLADAAAPGARVL